ncbi:DUF58 domain-containing protein [Rubrimonas cliftonensis]|uniref:DUF58 domain-containing protein n=1 Tax=Rubrimonas cliftonensis TaxID=89524 RepID=A0A1H4FIK3_9RHOB|nr:DUF58 domain-containing protein [Rubrimonas cliftonensis]SEA96588.1 Protein of unknown function DUF58 [Rubrimonas cliftonensis]
MSTVGADAGAATATLFEALAWRLRARQPGARLGRQRGRQRGAGDAFADVAPLMRWPDPRRIDLRRSALDPFGEVFVRRFETPAAVDVTVLLDWSGSLAASAAADRRAMAAILAAGLAQAAARAGDRVSIVAAPGDGAAVMIRPPTRRADADAILDALAALPPRGGDAEPLRAAAAETPLRGALVFLVSDFELSPEALDDVLGTLDGRDVVPLWLRDTGLDRIAPRWGVSEIVDPETGAARLALTRPALARRHAAARVAAAAALETVFAAHGRAPIMLADQIDVAELAAALGEAAL